MLVWYRIIFDADDYFFAAELEEEKEAYSSS